jgi:hypothetical protein
MIAQQVHNTNDSTTGTQHLLYYNLRCVPVVLLFVLCTCCTIMCVVYLLYYHLCCVPVVPSFVLVQQVQNTHDNTTGTQHT